MNVAESWEFVGCNLCGSNSYEKACSYGDIQIVKCSTCGLVYRNPRLKEAFSREFYGGKYYEKYNEIEETISEARQALFRKALQRLENSSTERTKRILDVGCGKGHFLKLAKESGWEVDGVELSTSACEYGKNKLGITILNKSIEEARFKDNSFDAITLWNVFDHLPDPLIAAKIIRGALKEGGILMIRVPNANFHLLTHRFFNILPMSAKFKDPSIIVNYGFSSKTIKEMLQKAGFKKIKVENSPLSFGDPYKSFNVSEQLTDKLKQVIYLTSNLIFYLSVKRFIAGSSMLVFARK